jgi:bacterioferritin (cytochrome b1)
MSERIYGDLVGERAAAVTQRRLLIRLHNSDPQTSALLRGLLVQSEAHVNYLSELRLSQQEWVDHDKCCLS